MSSAPLSASAMPILDARAIVKDYPSVKVLKQVDLSVMEGDTLAVIGPNGAGKTTLFKVLSGEVFADSGIVSYDGRDITRMPAWRRVREGFGRSFQVASVFLDLTAAENVLVAVEAYLAQKTPRSSVRIGCRPAAHVRELVDETLEEVGLASKGFHQARFLSHGDKKRLELAMSLALRPRILLLDEPTAGMAPADRQASIELIAAVKARHGMTVVLTEHDMDVVFGLATRVVVLHHGELIASGTADEVRQNPLVRDVYLGSETNYA
ncbi:amino acid/amide ABC transporter ATP-binding protein 1, HAAT family [Hoeflea sp. IMCC20628]|uniref:ABC transporter ATP-binding protein n=1 Tax=Hoeflea sp. IMCC20628 TaxID=1620421 RepID=UPI00063ACE23|nr:ABC transporter ATP-binding protein [Hoeflea sp. IMCC20628]AKH98874.1 amino acid/amide ABC transporter ATP-binding protein 1, HAAT family [Hoeflea sp. IMCC20628]